MTAWDTQSINASLSYREKDAENRMQECKQRIPNSPAHRAQYDQALVKSWVYTSLVSKTFLESQSSLLKALEELREDKYFIERTKHQSLDNKDLIEVYWKNEVDSLINQYKSL